MFDRDFSQAIVKFSDFEFSQIAEAFGFGGFMLLVGMATVFAVLCILWLCLTLFKLGFHDLPEKRKANALANATVEVDPVTESVDVTDGLNGEIVAAIAAAIAMAESESSGIKFRVVSFRRK